MQNLQKEENKSLKIDSVGIFIYDRFYDLDIVGIQSALSGIIGTKVFLIAAQKGLVKGLNTYMVDHDISEIDHLDVLMIPGGLKGTCQVMKDSLVLNWIRKIDRTSTYTASVCTGAWILGAAGLLKGHNATSNWYRAEEMLRNYGATYQNKRWVQSGKYWTAAGVSAGIDMGITMVMATKGKTYAAFVMLNLEYDPQPPMRGGSKDKSNPGIVRMMTEMYDDALKDAKEIKNNSSK